MAERYSSSRSQLWVVTGTVLLLCLLSLQSALGALATNESSTEHFRRLQQLNKPTAGNPTLEVGVHKVGNILFSITNYGIFGNQADPSITDPETGLPAPSCQYPRRLRH